jgi:hypothetical protein
MKRHLLGVAVVAVMLAALLIYRAWGVEPREWGALCVQPSPPLACAPRAALLWLQQYYLWGGIALVLGLWAFVRAPMAVAVAAVAVGAAAVVNYNATWGMVGAALGAWAWIMPRRAPAAAAPSGSR